MRRICHLGLVPLILLHGGSALAVVDAEVLVGKRWYTFGTDPLFHVAADEVALAAHIDPIPLVPVSFGARLSSGTLNKSDIIAASNNTLSSIGTATVTEAALDFKVWVPMFPFLTPYARLTMPVYGVWKVSFSYDGTSQTEEARLTGAQISVGAAYSPLPWVAVLVEFNRGIESYKTTSNKVNGQGVSLDGKSYPVSSNAVFVGAQMSF